MTYLGYFREDLQSIECARCPDGTYSDQTGLVAESECTPCDAGWVCGTPGLTVHPEAVEFLCPRGFVCGMKTNLYESRVTKCPGGFFCGTGTTPETQYDHSCLAGYFCPPGTSEISVYNNICPEGYYCPVGDLVSGQQEDMNGDGVDELRGVHVVLPCAKPIEGSTADGDSDNDNDVPKECEAYRCPQGIVLGHKYINTLRMTSLCYMLHVTCYMMSVSWLLTYLLTLKLSNMSAHHVHTLYSL